MYDEEGTRRLVVATIKQWVRDGRPAYGRKVVLKYARLLLSSGIEEGGLPRAKRVMQEALR